MRADALLEHCKQSQTAHDVGTWDPCAMARRSWTGWRPSLTLPIPAQGEKLMIV